MSNAKTFAKAEFDLMRKLGEGKPDDEQYLVLEFEKEILALVDKFGESGQSGGSAPYTAGSIIHVLKSLLAQNPATPITGADDEFYLCDDDGLYQNMRCSAVFRRTDADGEYTFSHVNSIIFQGEDEYDTFSGSIRLDGGVRISSSCDIKAFPFTPKTFYVDVKREKFDPLKHIDADAVDCGDNGVLVYSLKDPSQLEAVKELYNL